MKILFLHGWHSVVAGIKPTYLMDQGHEVMNPSLDDNDFEVAMKTAQSAFDEHRPDVVVGSSRGGAIAINLANERTPLVLLCPAWKNWGHSKKVTVKSIILHSKQDEVVPYADSVELVRLSGPDRATLMEVGKDHRLADIDSLAVMLWACQIIVSSSEMPWSDCDEDLSSGNEFIPNTGSAGTSQEEGCYLCDACGEEIVVPIDLHEGNHQKYVEDCPVCCRANVIHVSIDEEGQSTVWAEPEQDHD